MAVVKRSIFVCHSVCFAASKVNQFPENGYFYSHSGVWFNKTFLSNLSLFLVIIQCPQSLGFNQNFSNFQEKKRWEWRLNKALTEIVLVAVKLGYIKYYGFWELLPQIFFVLFVYCFLKISFEPEVFVGQSLYFGSIRTDLKGCLSP